MTGVPPQVIPGHEARSVEALCWAAGERLFGAGLGGDITEYDLARLCAARSVDGCGGPIWSMAANSSGTQLAVSAAGTGTGTGAGTGSPSPGELGRRRREGVRVSPWR